MKKMIEIVGVGIAITIAVMLSKSFGIWLIDKLEGKSNV